MTIYVNAKINSLSENNHVVSFEPNNHGFYNISDLYKVFTDLKSEEIRSNPNYQSDKLENHLKSSEMANEFFFTHMGDALGLYKQGGEYWGNKISFQLCLRSQSELFSIADHTLEKFFKGEFDHFSYNDLAQYTTMLYSIYNPTGSDIEAYKSFCIFNLSKLYSDLEFVQDYVIEKILIIKKVRERLNFNQDEYEALQEMLWFQSYKAMSGFIEDLKKFDPQLKDFDGFMLRYKRMNEAFLVTANELYFPAPTVVETTPVKKRSWFDRLLNG